MSRTDLSRTKQSKQIQALRNRFRQEGWRILEEQERFFRGKPKWELNDDIPNLIYSWRIQRNPVSPPLTLDFIAWSGDLSYEIFVNDCSLCSVRGTDVDLAFVKDRNLKTPGTLEKYEEGLAEFMENLTRLERSPRNRKRLFKRLKNGQNLEFFYRRSEEVSYTLRLEYKDEQFHLHSYHFDGSDVFDEANYKDEKMRQFDDFEGLLQILDEEFPGLELGD